MEWVERLNQSVRYIEEHLTEEIDYEQLGRIACCSAYHYQRMFAYMAGVSLGEYIRRRKMSLAAVDLRGGGMKIIDAAAKYGYSSPTAFNRAFQAFHGLAPSAVRGEGVSVKSFSPIAKGFEYNDYDDFGSSRSYGYRRPHLGHDMMGRVGTPIVAVESGYVEAIGWNQYGGWRIGIRSLDKKRYYYYAHLRQDAPYAEGLSEGDLVTAGDVIGYMGHTGYSVSENVNNIEAIHLHLGIEIMFDESQKDSDNEIWIDCYELTKFLYRNQTAVEKAEGTKEWKRVYDMNDPALASFLETP